jgi:hypothetical protein
MYLFVAASSSMRFFFGDTVTAAQISAKGALPGQELEWRDDVKKG